MRDMAAKQTGGERLERIARVIAGYDVQGWHRTATNVDDASGQWLAALLSEAGVEAEIEEHRIARFDPELSRIEAGGVTIEGLPAFDGGVTGPGGIAGKLGPPGSDARIAVVDAPLQSAAELDRVRRSGRHAAIVAITRGEAPGLAPHNAPAFRTPYGPPVLQVTSEAAPALADAVARGLRARVVAHGRRVLAIAGNVAGTIEGSDPELPPLLVMTPRSGWWQCASERGGGIAAWLEVARALAERPGARTVHFLASTGHELGHWGLEEFLARRPGLASGALATIHLGAGVGCAAPLRSLLYSSGPELRALAVAGFAAASATVPAVPPEGAVPPGESRTIHEAGGRYLSLIAANAHFHLQSDRWPDTVDVPAVAAVATAMAAAARKLATPDPFTPPKRAARRKA